MHPGRVDVLGAGGLILSRVLRRCSAPSLVASEADILDGIAWSMVRERPAAAPAHRAAVRLAGTARHRLAGRPGLARRRRWRASADDVRRLAAPTTSASSTPGCRVCSACPRLVGVARARRRAASGRRSPTSRTGAGRSPGWGDAAPAVLIVGLAPGRQRRQPDRPGLHRRPSGDWLFASLHRVGLAAQPTREHAGDGQRLVGARMVATVRCAPPQNKPTTAERDTCPPWIRQEIALLVELVLRVVVALGGFGWAGALRRARPRPGTRAEAHARSSATAPRSRSPAADGRSVTLLGCYHPSQQNTFTGRLTEPMLDDVLGRAASTARRHTIWRRATLDDVWPGPRIPTGRGSRLKSDPVWVRTPAGAPRSGYPRARGWWLPPCPCCTNGP